MVVNPWTLTNELVKHVNYLGKHDWGDSIDSVIFHKVIWADIFQAKRFEGTDGSVVKEHIKTFISEVLSDLRYQAFVARFVPYIWERM